MFRLGAIAAVCAACTRTPAPKDPTEHALYRDLERNVTVAQATGWGIDRIEIENMLERALDSVCRVDELGRRGLREWLEAEITRSGGPVEQAWRDRGKKLSNVSYLLLLERISMLLSRAVESSVDCPFYIEPENPFPGRQISENRWELTVGGGGTASALAQGKNTDISAGGSGRLLIGRMFANGDGLYIGADVGGSAQFPKNMNGQRTTLELGADIITPIVYRRTLLNTYVEFEGGWLGHSTERDWGAIDNGIHAGVAFGGRALRQRFVFPGAALAFAYERLFVTGDDLTTIKISARVTLDLDL
ncbi:MAG TPA: hypothetical protein VLB44_04745 [Kofleriaceae bacterium]|nr:hypothetical protein [Kofleriaceae bacterium]